jgi:hypothetical protein
VTIKAFNSEFQKLTGKTILENELRQAWSRIQFTYDPLSYHSSGERIMLTVLDSWQRENQDQTCHGYTILQF